MQICFGGILGGKVAAKLGGCMWQSDVMGKAGG